MFAEKIGDRRVYSDEVTVSDLNNDQLAEATRLAEAMRSVGDILGSTDCELLVPTLVGDVHANRWSLQGREVYTLWNKTRKDVGGRLVKVPGATDRRFVDLLTGNNLVTLKVEGGSEVEMALPNDEVAIIGIFPNQK